METEMEDDNIKDNAGVHDPGKDDIETEPKVCEQEMLIRDNTENTKAM